MSTKYKIRNERGIHFVTFTVVEWVDVFIRSEYKDILIDSLRFCQAEKGLMVHAYCIMTNHLHLIISSKDGYHIQDIVRDFKKFTAFKIIQAIRENPRESRKSWMLETFRKNGLKNGNNKHFQFWKQDYHPVELDANYLMDQRLDYVHNNPVTAGFVNDPNAWIYSSARDYTGINGLIEIGYIG